MPKHSYTPRRTAASSSEAFERAFDYTMHKEGWDAQSDDARDPGGRTRYGISERWWPDMWRDGPPTLDKARSFYRAEFWDPLDLTRIERLAVQAEAFDSAVLCGIRNAQEYLQMAHNLVCQDRGQLAVDGDIGPITVAAVNALCRLPNRTEALVGAQNYYQADYLARRGSMRWAMPGWFARRLGVGELLLSMEQDT